MKTGIGSHTKPNNGATVDWLTPPEIVKALGPFDLDPCCYKAMPWRTADHMISPPADGLSFEWFGRVWLNPPYGPETGKWLEKLAAHGNGIAIVFARTETRMFFKHVWPKASALFFLQGRPHFYRKDGTRAKGNSGGPVVLVAYGANNAQWLKDSLIDGAFVELNQ